MILGLINYIRQRIEECKNKKAEEKRKNHYELISRLNHLYYYSTCDLPNLDDLKSYYEETDD